MTLVVDTFLEVAFIDLMDQEAVLLPRIHYWKYVKTSFRSSSLVLLSE
jgi:hypothetical protein